MPNYNADDLKSGKGIGAIIKDNEGNILMQEHIKYGFWTVPVGKVKENQTVEEALKEELFEECNIIIKDYRLLAQREWSYDREGKIVKVDGYLFEILDYVGNIENKEPHKHNQQIFRSLDIVKTLDLSHFTILYLELMNVKRERKAINP